MKDSTIQVKVHGTKPENIVFIIHEVIEILISEVYYGLRYDYCFPCPDCLEEGYTDPCLFSGTLLKRAVNHKAPFLQCNKYFHAISIQEMLAVMPMDGNSTLDINLGNSIRDLKQLKKNLKYDIAFWYCHDDKEPTQSTINPLDILNKLTEDYNLWYSQDPANEKLDHVTSAIKDSRLVILGNYLFEN